MGSKSSTQNNSQELPGGAKVDTAEDTVIDAVIADIPTVRSAFRQGVTLINTTAANARSIVRSVETQDLLNNLVLQLNANFFPPSAFLAQLFSHAQHINPSDKNALRKLNYLARTLTNNMDSAQAQNHTQQNRNELREQFKEVLRLLQQNMTAIRKLKLPTTVRTTKPTIAPTREVITASENFIRQKIKKKLEATLFASSNPISATSSDQNSVRQRLRNKLGDALNPNATPLTAIPVATATTGRGNPSSLSSSAFHYHPPLTRHSQGGHIQQPQARGVRRG